MELIWRHTFFNELRVQPTAGQLSEPCHAASHLADAKEQAVLLAEAALNPKDVRASVISSSQAT